MPIRSHEYSNSSLAVPLAAASMHAKGPSYASTRAKRPAHLSKNVGFADNVAQRRYSKRTGRILGDTTIHINDRPKIVV